MICHVACSSECSSFMEFVDHPHPRGCSSMWPLQWTQHVILAYPRLKTAKVSRGFQRCFWKGEMEKGVCGSRRERNNLCEISEESPPTIGIQAATALAPPSPKSSTGLAAALAETAQVLDMPSQAGDAHPLRRISVRRSWANLDPCEDGRAKGRVHESPILFFVVSSSLGAGGTKGG